MVKKIGCKTQSITGVGVSMANGKKMWAQEWCKGVLWSVQGLQQCTDFYVLPLMRCDLVLGVQ